MGISLGHSDAEHSDKAERDTRHRPLGTWLAALTFLFLASLVTLVCLQDGGTSMSKYLQWNGLDDEALVVSSDLIPALPHAVTQDVPPEVRPAANPIGRPASSTLDLHTPEWPVLPFDERRRYISYLSHSGFNNARIAFVNALVTAHLLNRTLIVGPVQLGNAVPWSKNERLQTALDTSERSSYFECAAIKDRAQVREKCGIYWNSRRADWSWFVDAKTLSAKVDIISRPSHQRSYFRDVLKVNDSQIRTFNDNARASYQFFDSEIQRSEFTEPITVDQLRALDDVTLLEFGSMFQPARWVLKQENNVAFKQKMEDLMAFRQPLLEWASEAIAKRLGGRDAYFSAHLRLGQGKDTFMRHASSHIATVYHDILERGYRLPPSVIKSLTNSPPPPLTPSSPGEGSISCRSALYPETSPLSILNTPLYIATDDPHPDTDKRLAVFRNTFPCLFFLQDFHSLEEIKFVLEETKDEEGVPLGVFLAPFVEAEVLAKGRRVIGTHGSSYSRYVIGVLYRWYHTVSARVGSTR